MEKLAYSVDETLKVVPFGRSTLYEHIATGEIRVAKVGRRTLVMADSLREFLEAHVVDSGKQPAA